VPKKSTVPDLSEAPELWQLKSALHAASQLKGGATTFRVGIADGNGDVVAIATLHSYLQLLHFHSKAVRLGYAISPSISDGDCDCDLVLTKVSDPD
jgi:hypothetical protein